MEDKLNFILKEDNLKKVMQPQILKSKNNNIFENGRLPQSFLKGKQHQFFLKMEDDLKKEEPKTIENKNNGLKDNLNFFWK